MKTDLLKRGERHLAYALRRWPAGERDDLGQHARLALLDAGKRYEEREGGASPDTYCRRVVERAVAQQAAREHRRARLVTVSFEALARDESGAPVELPDPDAACPERAALAAEVRSVLAVALRALPPRQRAVVEDTSGWRTGAPLKLAACARRRALTYSEARTALVAGHRALREVLESAGWGLSELLVTLKGDR